MFRLHCLSQAQQRQMFHVAGSNPRAYHKAHERSQSGQRRLAEPSEAPPFSVTP